MAFRFLPFYRIYELIKQISKSISLELLNLRNYNTSVESELTSQTLAKS